MDVKTSVLRAVPNPVPKWRLVWKSDAKRGNMGAAIKQHREAKGYTQQSLAVAVGVSVGQVSRWERDLDNPTMKNLKALVAVLGCDYEALVK